MSIEANLDPNTLHSSYLLLVGAIILSWLGMFFFFTGVGLGFRWLLGFVNPQRHMLGERNQDGSPQYQSWYLRHTQLWPQSRDDLHATIWLGWAAVILLLQLIHLFFRIDTWVLFVLVLFSLGGFVVYQAEIRNLVNPAGFLSWYSRRTALVQSFRPRSLLVVLPLSFLILWMATRALAPVTNSDTGLYHMGSVAWNSAYPIVKGLGNLHGRFAYNNAYFLYAALLDVGPWAGRSYHLANSFLTVLLLTQAFLALRPAVTESRQNYAPSFLLALLLAIIIRTATAPELTSLTADYVLVLLGIVLVWQLTRFLRYTNAHTGEEHVQLFTIFALATVGITIKLSFVALAVTSCVIAIWIWIRRNLIEPRELTVRQISIAWLSPLLIGTFGIGIWMVRGLLLSGYIAYPSLLGSLAVPWRIPRPLVLSEAYWIRSWARAPWTPWVDVLYNWDWLIPWSQNIPNDLIKALGLTVIALSVWLVRFVWLRHKQQRTKSDIWLLMLPLVVAILFWFISAPSFRFAGATFWLLGATSVLFAFDNEGFEELRYQMLLRMVIIVIVFLYAWRPPQPLIMPLPEDGTLPPVPVPDVSSVETQTGLSVQVTNPGEFRCWNATLPCTPYLRQNLHLFLPDDLSNGFYLDETFTYVDFQQSATPEGIVTPPDLGVALVSYLVPAGFDAGVRDDPDKLRLLLYSPQSTAVTLVLSMATRLTGDEIAYPEIDVILNEQQVATVSADQQLFEVDLMLQRDYNELTFKPSDGAIFLGDEAGIEGEHPLPAFYIHKLEFQVLDDDE